MMLSQFAPLTIGAMINYYQVRFFQVIEFLD